ncbi:elongation of very long chain fatty acids 4 [Paramuricea clavata]|uniref:Elongation of very long chain fatty acids protein n=2 Tax=Paramuricea clavata TaxID=317549 RepID=A0A6S7ITY1_PARCT|nr:elongation of very long chain fatty acids 4 [Paramuricea clavata]
MERRQPLELKIPMALYNFGATALNVYCFSELLIGSWKAGYRYICNRVIISTEPQHMRIANAIWWFYLSKYYEMLDTVFFILRKKNNQITFLHVYHHTSILALWWIGIKWVPGGTAFYSSMVNSFIHIVMYTYYGLSVFPSIRSYLWWKRYLTQLQLIQFLSYVVQAVLALYDDCGFPRWVSYGMMSYMITMISLFGNFYFRTYRNARSKREGEHNKQNGDVQIGIVQNGTQKKIN